jgi:hypothetical protein
MLRAVLLSAASLLLVSCATIPTGAKVVAEAKEALDGTPLCCKDLSTAPRSPLPLAPVTLQIDKKSPAFDFGGNKAFFVLHELPAYERPYSIFLTSQAAGTQQDIAVFIPRVAMYDANFNVTRYFDEKSLRNRGNNLERTVFINPANQHERYIAIYGSDLSASIERAYSMVTVQTVSTGLVAFNLYSGIDGKSVLRSSPAGGLQIEVQGLVPEKK